MKLYPSKKIQTLIWQKTGSTRWVSGISVHANWRKAKGNADYSKHTKGNRWSTQALSPHCRKVAGSITRPQSQSQEAPWKLCTGHRCENKSFCLALQWPGNLSWVQPGLAPKDSWKRLPQHLRRPVMENGWMVYRQINKNLTRSLWRDESQPPQDLITPVNKQPGAGRGPVCSSNVTNLWTFWTEGETVWVVVLSTSSRQSTEPE